MPINQNADVAQIISLTDLKGKHTKRSITQKQGTLTDQSYTSGVSQDKQIQSKNNKFVQLDPISRKNANISYQMLNNYES